MDAPAIAFGGASGGSGCEVETGLAVFGEFAAGSAAGLGFAIKLLGDGSRTAEIAERQDFDLEVAAFGFDGEQVADADFAGRARGLLVRLNPAEVAGLRREGAGFEEARRPEPFVESRAGHAFSVRQRRDGQQKSGQRKSG